MVTVCAWAYVEYRTLPEASAFLYGVKPAMIALVLNALIELGRTAIKTWFLASLFLSGVVLGLAGMNEILILIVAAVAAGAAHLVFDGRRTRPDRTRLPSGFFIALTLQGTTAAAGGIPSFSLSALFLFFLKVGSVLFGSGYVLLAFLRADLVERWHWLTETQLLDAIAVGQLTPGPVFTAATFIGYLLGGSAGAVAATAGIFLPAFLFVSVSGSLIPRIRRSPVAGAVLNGVNAASLSLMAVVTYQLGRSALIDLWSWLICAASAAVVFRYHINPVWIVAGGAVTGLLVHNRGMR
jgi:chromate transporter